MSGTCLSDHLTLADLRANPDELLPLDTAKDLTKVSYRYIYRETWLRRLPSVKLGRKILVRAGDLAAWIDSNTRGARS